MELFELKKLVCDKLKVAPWSVVDYNSQSVEVKIRGRKFLISTALCVCDAGARFYDANDSDARQLEKLLRGEQWDGTGLPPVGTICQMRDDNDKWVDVEIIANHKGFAHGWQDSTENTYYSNKPSEFRPLRTERDKAIEQMMSTPKPCGFAIQGICEQLYDAIVAGKIDGLGKVG